MKTPITDTLWKSGPAALEMLEHARRLELDRAALMESLERVVDAGGNFCDLLTAADNAQSALAAARANFPEP